MRIPTTRSEAQVKNGNKFPESWGGAVAMKASQESLTESDLNNAYNQIADSKDVLESLEMKECDNRDQQAVADSMDKLV
jgi:hypothetical protein